MAEVILYMGKSGVGKSSALRNLPPKETVIISPNQKSLPFPGGGELFNPGKGNFIKNTLLESIKPTLKDISDKHKHIKYVVLEDFTHLFSARIFSPKFLSRNTGSEAFQRWNDFGAAVHQSIFSDQLRDDLTIIVIHHTETKEDGSVGFKSAGKLLDNTIDFPSYFTYILHGVVISSDKGVKYKVLTNRDGIRHAKTPFGALPLYVNNDLKAIIDRIKDFKKGNINSEVKWVDGL